MPVNALVQYPPDAGNKGGVITASTLLSYVGILAASGLYFLLAGVWGLQPRAIFLVGAGLSLVGTVAIILAMPQSLFRLVLWVVSRTIYRVKVLGRDHIPERGGALFVCNHLSLADAILLQASTDHPIRFLMLKAIYHRPLIKPWAVVSGAIPISSEQRPREMIKSLQAERPMKTKAISDMPSLILRISPLTWNLLAKKWACWLNHGNWDQ